MKLTTEVPKDFEVILIGGDAVVTEQQRQQMYQVLNESIDRFLENDHAYKLEPEEEETMSYILQARKDFESDVQEVRAAIMRLCMHSGVYSKDKPHLYAADLQLGNLILLPEAMPQLSPDPVPGGLDHSLPTSDRETV